MVNISLNDSEAPAYSWKNELNGILGHYIASNMLHSLCCQSRIIGRTRKNIYRPDSESEYTEELVCVLGGVYSGS